MDTNSLTHKTLKNITYSFFGYGWSLLFALFVTPIIVFKLGVDNYGVYIFINVASSMIGLVELGLSTAFAKYIAEYHGAKNEEKIKNLLYSVNSLLLIIGIIGLLAFVVVGLFSKSFVSTSAISTYNLTSLFIIAGVSFLVNAIAGIFVMIPTALQRFDLSTKIATVQLTLSSLSTLAVVLLGLGLQAIFLVQLFFSLVFALVFYYFARKILPLAKLKFGWHKQEIVHCYKFGLVAFISNISGQTLAYFDKLIIPIFINPASLSYYSLAGSMASKSTGAMNSITSILFPMVSSLQGGNDYNTIKNLYIKSFRFTIILNSAITLSICFYSYKIMQYWLNEDFAIKTSKILIVLAITYFMISLYGQLVNFLLGLGKTKLLAIFSTSMAVINIILLFVLLPKYQIMGAALAYLISLLPTIYIFYYIEKKLLKLEGRFIYYFKLYSKIFFTAIIFYFITKFLLDPLLVGFKTLLLVGPLSVIIYLVLFKIFGFYEDEDYQMIKSFSILFFKRFSFKN